MSRQDDVMIEQETKEYWPTDEENLEYYEGEPES